MSCKSKSGSSENILPVNIMKEVMWDMIQADEYASFYIVKDSTKNLKQETLKLYSKVFSLHKVSSDDFGRSHDYYKGNPAMEKELLDSLQTYGNKMRETNFQKHRLTLPVQPIADTTLKN